MSTNRQLLLTNYSLIYGFKTTILFLAIFFLLTIEIVIVFNYTITRLDDIRGHHSIERRMELILQGKSLYKRFHLL